MIFVQRTTSWFRKIYDVLGNIAYGKSYSASKFFFQNSHTIRETTLNTTPLRHESIHMILKLMSSSYWN